MDGFIDNIITITMDAKSAALLVIQTLLKPLQESEPLKCNDPLSLSKLAGEEKMAEHKTCLGWDIKIHSLRVFLPKKNKTD